VLDLTFSPPPRDPGGTRYCVISPQCAEMSAASDRVRSLVLFDCHVTASFNVVDNLIHPEVPHITMHIRVFIRFHELAHLDQRINVVTDGVFTNTSTSIVHR